MASKTFARRMFIAAVLCVHAALIAWSATRHSPTYDEVAWLPAGISHWEFGRFDLARVNPPLVRMIAAMPVVAVGHDEDWANYAVHPGGRPEFQVGLDFMRANGRRSFWLFILARWACIPFSILGAYVCYRWASDLYGALAGCFSVALWCFCPNVLAHAELVTSDVAAAATGCAACYLFWRWLREPSADFAFIVGVLLGLAELAKTTWVVLFAIWPTLFCFWRLTADLRRKGGPLGRHIGGLCVILLTGLVVLNAGYGFDGFIKPLGQFPFVSRALRSDGMKPIGVRENRFHDSWLGKLPVPLPESYLLGIDQTKFEFEMGKRSYLHGQWRRGGWWYYYLYALAVKIPLGTWSLGALAVVATAIFPVFRKQWRNEVVLLTPAITVLLLASSQTGSNRHFRYLLPAFPFVFVWLSKLAGKFESGSNCAEESFPKNSRRHAMFRLPLLVLSALAVSWSTASCLGVYPHCLAYFNAIGGGPLAGHAHLLDSNIDWGQDLLYLRDWMARHPDAAPLRLAYFGMTDPGLVGIQFELPPRLDAPSKNQPSGKDEGARPGWYAVSVNFLRGYEAWAFDGSGRQVAMNGPHYAYFLQFEPVAIAGRSIYIYHLSLADANRLRAHVGLPLLDDQDGFH